MKEQAIQYLAMDVHQATVVACIRDERGAITMRATVPTEARAILSLVRGAGSRVHVAFEEGTQAQWLHDLLQPHAERVVVCSVRGKSVVSNKTDRIDAEQLSELLRLGSLTIGIDIAAARRRQAAHRPSRPPGLDSVVLRQRHGSDRRAGPLRRPFRTSCP